MFCFVFSAIKYTDEQEDTRKPNDIKVFEEPCKSRNVVISPFLDRVAYAKSQRIRRNQLSKSAPIRKEPLEKKTPIFERPTAKVANINFSERASYWKTDPSEIARKTKWEDIKTPIFSTKHLNKLKDKPPDESPEQKLALPDSTKDSKANGNSSLVAAEESSPSHITNTISRFSPSQRKRGITESKVRTSPACQTVGFKPWTKTIPRRPKSATKPLFSLTSLESEEEDIIRALSPMGKDKLENEQTLAITENSEKKFNSTSSGIKFTDFGPSSSSQRAKTKVNVTGFGQSARKRNKAKERANANIKLNPDVSQLALLDRAESPQGNPPFLSHYTVTKMNTGVQKQLKPTEVNVEFTTKFPVHPASRLEEQGFFSAGYINKILNRSNNSNQNVLEEQPIHSPELSGLSLMFLPKKAESLEAKVEELLNQSKQVQPMSAETNGKDRGDIISIPSVSIIDNYSEIDVLSSSDNDEEFDDNNSTDLYRSLLDCTFNSMDASIVELDLNERNDDDDHDVFVSEDEFERSDIAELTDASENGIRCSVPNDNHNSADISGRCLQHFDIHDVTYDSADASIDDIELPRAIWVNSPNLSGSSLDFERFMYCSESSHSGTDQSRVSPLLFSDSELSTGQINKTNTANILNKSRLESPQTGSHVDSSRQSDRNHCFSDINKSALIWKTSKRLNEQFPQKNESFRMAMENPVIEMDNYFKSTPRSKHTCLLDLLNDEDQDLTSLSAAHCDVSKSSLSIPSDFGEDLNYDDHSYYMKTSTPIKPTMNRLCANDDAPIHQKELVKRDSSKDLSSMLSECADEISPECYGKSSEEDEIVEIIYTTSSSEEEEEISNGERHRDSPTTGESLNSTSISQISGIRESCILGDSVTPASDSCLSNLNFATTISSQRNNKTTNPRFNKISCNVTSHPDVTRSYDSGMNQSHVPQKAKLRRSTARTNLLAKFDNTVKKDRDEYERENDNVDVNTLIQFGNSKSPYDTLRPDAKNDEIYKVRAAQRRQRYSKNPSSSLKSQFWAPRQYVEETEKAVYNLLKAEFSSPNESL